MRPRRLKKLPRRSGRNRRGSCPRPGDRNLVPGRGPHRPEEQDHEALGQARNKAVCTARSAHEVGLYLRRDMPQAGQGGSPGYALVRYPCHEPASDRDFPAMSPTRRTPSSSWTRQDGTCPTTCSSPKISRSCPCHPNRPNSTRSKTSGSSCAITGSQTESSNPTKTLSTIAATHGEHCWISPGRSCPSVAENGHMGSDQ